LNIKKNAMAVYYGEEPSRIPWLIYGELCPRCYMSRQLMNRGLGLKVSASVLRAEMPHVHVETVAANNIIQRTYHTPVGDLRMKERIGLPEGTGGSWTVEHPVKDVKDLDVVQFMAEDTAYVPDYEPFIRVERDLDADGVVFVWAGYSPLQEMQIELMGYRTFAVMLHRYPRELETLARVLEKRTDERYRVIAESPAEIVNGTDNINSDMVSPKLFERYMLPFYKKQAQVLHKNGKILEDHMDGKLRNLRDLISKADVDVVEAFTPPPMGDLPVPEARRAWKGKVIGLNFPGSVFLEGLDAVRRKALTILSEAAPGDRFMVMVTEDIPPRQRWSGLAAVTGVLRKHGGYPVSVTPDSGTGTC